MECKNCNTTFSSKYCPNCGQANEIKRIDVHYIIHEIEHVLHFERGILFTIRELTTNPGQNIKNYLTENRNRLVKPIIFIIVSSLIYTIINHWFHIEEGSNGFNDPKMKVTSSIFEWIQSNYGYANIIMGVFIAFWIKLFFRKYDFNFFEILILLCFVIGMGMLIYSVFAMIQGITHLKIMQIAGMSSILYCSWAIGQFYDGKKIINYLKAFFAYILGMLTFVLTAIIIGVLIDLMIK